MSSPVAGESSPTNEVSPDPQTKPGVPWVLMFVAVAYAIAVPWETLPFPVGTPSALVGAALLVVWFVARITGSFRTRITAGLRFWLFLWMFWNVLTVLWSWAPTASLTSARSVVALALAAVAVAQIFKSNPMLAFKGMAVGSTLAAVVVIVSPNNAQRLDRVSFADIDENIMAFHLGLGIAAALYVLLSPGRGSHRILALAGVVAMFAAVLLTGSRTGVAVALATLVLAGVFAIRSRVVLLLVIPIGLALTWLVSLLAQSGRLPERVSSLEGAAEAGDLRGDIIGTFLNYFDTWWLFGIGTGADDDFLRIVGAGFQPAHSAFWKVWIELGLIGLVIWIGVLVMVVIGAWRSPDRMGLVLALPTIAGFFYTLGPIQSNMLWLYFGLAFAGFVRWRGADEQVAEVVAPATRETRENDDWQEV